MQAIFRNFIVAILSVAELYTPETPEYQKKLQDLLEHHEKIQKESSYKVFIIKLVERLKKAHNYNDVQRIIQSV